MVFFIHVGADLSNFLFHRFLPAGDEHGLLKRISSIIEKTNERRLVGNFFLPTLLYSK